MRKRKVLATILCLAMVFGSMNFAFADTAVQDPAFADMPDNWSTAALNRAVENGLLKGYQSGGKNLIKANDTLTRAELAVVVNRAFNALGAADISVVTDVAPTAWYAKDMAKAVQMRTFALDARMRPNDKITRQEAFAVLARAFKLTDADEEYKALDKFSDKGEIAEWALKDLNGLAAAGYIQGSDAKLSPKANITRAEFAMVMDSLVKQYIDTAGAVSKVVATGNVMVRVSGVILQNLTVKGDLILADGIGEGDVTLDNVKVEGRTVVRGGGENSIIIKGNSDLGRVIVTKVDGKVRILVEGNANIEIIYVDDGSDDVIVEGTIGTLEVAGNNVTVTAVNATITNGFISGNNSKIVLAEGSDVTNRNVEGEASEIVGGDPPVRRSGSSASVTVSFISVSPATLTLTAGGATGTITATILPANATNKNVIWTSSDEAVATVDNGEVTPLAAGTAIITATSVADNTKKATVEVLVAEDTEAADNTAIAAAKSAIEGETYTATQAEVGDAAAAEAKAQALVNALDLEGTTAVVVPGTFTAAETGTVGNPSGTDGSFTFTVTIDKGAGTQVTSDQQTMTITATPYDATLSAVTAIFDRNVDMDNGVTVTMNPNGRTLQAIKHGNDTLTPSTHYLINDNDVTISGSYLTSILPNWRVRSEKLTFDFDQGKDLEFVVTGINTKTGGMSGDIGDRAAMLVVEAYVPLGTSFEDVKKQIPNQVDLYFNPLLGLEEEAMNINWITSEEDSGYKADTPGIYTVGGTITNVPLAVQNNDKQQVIANVIVVEDGALLPEMKLAFNANINVPTTVPQEYLPLPTKVVIHLDIEEEISQVYDSLNWVDSTPEYKPNLGEYKFITSQTEESGAVLDAQITVVVVETLLNIVREATFDMSDPQDITVEIPVGDIQVYRIKNVSPGMGWAVLVEGADKDYTRDGNNFTIRKEYLIAEARYDYRTTLTFDLSDGMVPILRIDKAKYTVTYNNNGSTGGNVPTDGATYYYDDEVTVLGNTDLVKESYTFMGWNTASDGSGTTYTAGDTFNITGNTTLYAVWGYIVTFDSNGGTTEADPATMKVEANESVGMLPTPPTKAGYTFAGWYTDNGTFGDAFTELTQVTANITVYAKWLSSDTGINANNPGDIVTWIATVPSNSILVFQGTTADSLKGAIRASDYSTQDYEIRDSSGQQKSDEVTLVTGDKLRVTAEDGITTGIYNITIVPLYRVTYDGNDAESGSVPIDTNKYSNENPVNKVVVLDNTGSLERDGYTFGGWNTQSDGQGTTYQAGDSFQIQGNTTLYALWLPR